MTNKFYKDPFEDVFKEDSLEEENPEFISLMSGNEEETLNPEDIPDEIAILPLRNTVLYPGVVVPITVGRDKSITLINEAREKEALIGVTAQKSTSVEDPGKDDLYSIGTLAKIVKLLKMPDGNVTVIIQGKQRYQTENFTQEQPYIKAQVSLYEDDNKDEEENDELKAMVSTMKDMATQIIQMSPNIPSEATSAIKNITNTRFLINFISSNLNAEVNEKQRLLEVKDLNKKATQVLEHLNEEYKMLDLKNQIQSKVKSDIDKQQRDYFLQQQMKTIQEELGQDNPDKEIEDIKAGSA